MVFVSGVSDEDINDNWHYASTLGCLSVNNGRSIYICILTQHTARTQETSNPVVNIK